MLRSKTYWFVLALLATSGITTACNSADIAGPSQATASLEKQGPNHDEKQGPNHYEKQGPNH